LLACGEGRERVVRDDPRRAEPAVRRRQRDQLHHQGTAGTVRARAPGARGRALRVV